jgi:hypothetical protein
VFNETSNNRAGERTTSALLENGDLCSGLKCLEMLKEDLRPPNLKKTLKSIPFTCRIE